MEYKGFLLEMKNKITPVKRNCGSSKARKHESCVTRPSWSGFCVPRACALDYIAIQNSKFKIQNYSKFTSH